jgi:hypothetical protein
MPDLTPADELRAASAKLRTAATSPDPDPQARMHPGVAVSLAMVFDQWARVAELAPDLLNRVGGQETLATARAILTGGQHA